MKMNFPFNLLLCIGLLFSLNINAQQSNPLLAKWAGPYGGVPAFDKVKVEDFKPALETAIEGYLAEIDKIAQNKSKPDFQNTIAALEKSGQTYGQLLTIYGIWSGTMKNAAFAEIEREIAPKLAAVADKIFQNEA